MGATLCKSVSLCIFILFWIFPVSVFARTLPEDTLSIQEKQIRKVTLKGKVVEGNGGECLPGAHIYIGEKKNLVAVTDRNGEFVLPDLPVEDIIISASFTGHQFFSKKYILKNDLNIGVIRLIPVILDEVIVMARPPLSVQRGDTTQFNAGALTLSPDADLEKLLKRLPGFEIVDGKIMAQGQEVKKLYVDGTEYFLDNPAAALKNLPASLISKVKMYDERSEEAKFSGYDDGSKFRSLNIETKNPNDLKYFGLGNLGYGISDNIKNTFKDNDYKAGVSLNLFDREKRITLAAKASNTQQANMLPNAKYEGRGGNNGSKEIQANYSSNFKKKLDISVNYQGTWRDSYSASLSQQDYFPTEKYESRIYDRESHSWSDGDNHSLNAKIDYRISEKDRIIFSPRISINKTGTKSVNLANSIENNDTINNSNTANDNHSDTYGINGSLAWMHAFKKKGRTLTTRLNLNYNNSTSDQGQIVRELYRNNQNVITDTSRNKLSTNDRLNYTWRGEVSYSEPLTEHSRLGFNYTYSHNMDKSDKESVAYRDQDFKERIGIDSALTNILENLRVSNQIGVNYNYNKEKISFNGGSNISMTQMENKYIFLGNTDSLVSSNYVDISPRADLNYRYAENRSMNVSYSGNTSSPDARQLQNILDVTDPLQVSKGNPDLKKAYVQRFSLIMNKSNTEKSTYFSLSLSGGQTINKMTSNVKFIQRDTLVNSYLLLRGARLTQPENLNGDWNVNMGTHYSFPWKKINFNTRLSYNFSHTPSIYDDLKNFTDAHTGSLGFSVFTNFSENLELFLNSNSSYSYSKNSTTGSSQYFNETLNAGVQWIFWKGILAGGDFDFSYYLNKKGDAINQSNNILNLFLGKKFGKKRQAELRFAANDIFRQKNTVNYSLNDLYAETSYNTNAISYYSISFSYRFNSMKNDKTAGPAQGETMMIK